MRLITLTAKQFENEADTVKDLVLGSLAYDGLLTDEQVVDWSRTHTIIVKQLSRISKFYRQLRGEGPNTASVIVAKIRDQGDGET